MIGFKIKHVEFTETVMGYKEPRSEDSGFEYALAVMK